MFQETFCSFLWLVVKPRKTRTIWTKPGFFFLYWVILKCIADAHCLKILKKSNNNLKFGIGEVKQQNRVKYFLAFISFIIFKNHYFRGRERERESERVCWNSHLLVHSSVVKASSRASCWELRPSLSHAWQEPEYLACHHCFPRCSLLESRNQSWVLTQRIMIWHVGILTARPNTCHCSFLLSQEVKLTF